MSAIVRRSGLSPSRTPSYTCWRTIPSPHFSPGEFGGEGEIRTPEPREGLPVFKTGAINRSATSPSLEASETCTLFCLTRLSLSGAHVFVLFPPGSRIWPGFTSEDFGDPGEPRPAMSAYGAGRRERVLTFCATADRKQTQERTSLLMWTAIPRCAAGTMANAFTSSGTGRSISAALPEWLRRRKSASVV